MGMIDYINGLSAGLFGELTNLNDEFKQELLSTGKHVISIGESDDTVYAWLGVRTDGIDWVGLDASQRLLLDNFYQNATDETLTYFESDILEYVHSNMDKMGFHYDQTQTVFTIYGKQRATGEMEDATFSIKSDQVFDWNDVDKHVLEATLTKVIAIGVLIVDYIQRELDFERLG